MNINADGGEYVEKGWQMHSQGHKVDSRGRTKFKVRANDDFSFEKNFATKGKSRTRNLKLKKKE